MATEQDYTRDLAEIRSMMERSSKFLLVSGWAGIMAGIYALAGAYIAVEVLNFSPAALDGKPLMVPELFQVIELAAVVLILAVGTAVFLSRRKATRRGERVWNATANRLVVNMMVPLVAGAIMIVAVLAKGVVSLMPPLTMIFYGLALFSAGKFTYGELRTLGFLQLLIGLASCFFEGYEMQFWATGFGVLHIVFGVYLHYKYKP